MKYFFVIIFFISNFQAAAQNRNSIWCFGDSAGIDFGSGTATPISSGMDGRGSCVSICDPSGNLQFYAETRAGIVGYSTLIYDRTHSIMLNGDSILGQGWYQELVIIPNPTNDSTFYLFTAGVSSAIHGLNYSIIDMRMNGGYGTVIQKNVPLQSFAQVDCINSIKHGNGRDWWLIFRKSPAPTFTFNNDFYTYLVSPLGIQNISIQSIGSQNRTDLGHSNFSPNGNKFVFINFLGIIELFDFDRCTGQLSNPIALATDPGIGPYTQTWSCEFSPDESKLYVTTNKDTSYLYQYDLNASNIILSKDTIFQISFPINTYGTLKLAPDNKIYLSSVYYTPTVLYYPYADSMYNMYNMNLSVINHPDSVGAACDFQPYSFFLGGKRTYLGLPNNPNYEMGPLSGSPCDSLTSISEVSLFSQSELFVYYSSDWQTAFINANKLKGSTYQLEVIDLVGKSIFRESGKLNPPYFTKNLNCEGFAKGMYLVNLVTERERLSQKFIVQ